MKRVQRTRRSILEYLKQHGRASLDELAQESGLAPMTVRGHLTVLERDGLIDYAEERGKVGRPRFVYSLTDQGHDLFPKSYHVLCNRILDALRLIETDAATLATQIAEQWVGEHAAQLEGKGFDERVHALAAIRTDEGAMAEIEKDADDYLLHQRHCPASCVAARHPDVICAAEIGYIRRALTSSGQNVSVERVSWIQNGDATCTYRIRLIRPRPPQESSLENASSDSYYRPAPAD